METKEIKKILNSKPDYDFDDLYPGMSIYRHSDIFILADDEVIEIVKNDSYSFTTTYEIKEKIKIFKKTFPEVDILISYYKYDLDEGQDDYDINFDGFWCVVKDIKEDRFCVIGLDYLLVHSKLENVPSKTRDFVYYNGYIPVEPKQNYTSIIGF